MTDLSVAAPEPPDRETGDLISADDFLLSALAGPDLGPVALWAMEQARDQQTRRVRYLQKNDFHLADVARTRQRVYEKVVARCVEAGKRRRG